MPFLQWKSKVPVIQKWNKMFFLDIFTWFDRACRALQDCIFDKYFEPAIQDKKNQKPTSKITKMSKNFFFFMQKKKHSVLQ